MCATTPADIHGHHYGGPTECFNSVCTLLEAFPFFGICLLNHLCRFYIAELRYAWHMGFGGYPLRRCLLEFSGIFYTLIPAPETLYLVSGSEVSPIPSPCNVSVFLWYLLMCLCIYKIELVHALLPINDDMLGSFSDISTKFDQHHL